MKAGDWKIVAVLATVVVVALLVKRGAENAAANVGTGTLSEISGLIRDGIGLYKERRD